MNPLFWFVFIIWILCTLHGIEYQLKRMLEIMEKRDRLDEEDRIVVEALQKEIAILKSSRP